METYDVAVIGGGPAGMSAALGADSTGARVILIERADSLGGILNQCTHLGFGLSYFGKALTGPEYARRFINKIICSRIKILTDTTVTRLYGDGRLTLSGTAHGYETIAAKAIVLASGCRERSIGALTIGGTRPSGVFTAGAAQKMLNINGWDIGTRFVILGSGDVGLIVARELALRGKEVLAVIEKNDKCGGLEHNRVNCLSRFNIPLITRSTVLTVHGTQRVSGVTVVSEETGAEQYICCDTLITSIGLIPERELLDGTDVLCKHIFLCGNACYVHNTADDVSKESELVGTSAAQFAARGTISDAIPNDSSNNIVTASKNAVSCTACPKNCAAVFCDGGWHGLLCGRSEPVLDS